MNTTKTLTITMKGRTAADLIGYIAGAEVLEAATDQTTFTIPADADIDTARNAQWAAYLKGGGNPRNKRSFSTTAAAVKRAIAKAA